MAGKIYTKTGDDGTTGLFGGQRVPKSSIRVDAYGTIDELNAYFGLILTKKLDPDLQNALIKLNNLMFIAGADVATPLGTKTSYKIDRISADDVLWLEENIDLFTSKMPELKDFILGGGTEQAALLHVARTVCRRVERLLVRLSEDEDLGFYIIKFFNRLSDFLFTAARYENFVNGVEDRKWTGR